MNERNVQLITQALPNKDYIHNKFGVHQTSKSLIFRGLKY